MKPELRDFLLQIVPPPTAARHVEYSIIMSADDERSRPTPFLIETALEAARIAAGVSLEPLRERLTEPPFYPEVWPGEHYRLLAALMTLLRPKVVVEIGTGGGLSALSMAPFLPDGAILATFDVLDWRSVPATCLIEEDFVEGGLRFYREDLCDPATVARHRALLESAEFILVDAAKDGVGETRLIENLLGVHFRKPPLVMFDDIKLWNMLRIWREISLPKLDLTSFGHWSGTGVVDWRARP